MRAALIAFLVATCTASAAVPTPVADVSYRAPTMQQYNHLKQRLGSMIACIGTGVPVVIHQGDDGRSYLVLPDQTTGVASTVLVANSCTEAR